MLINAQEAVISVRGKGRFERYITKQEKTMKKRTRKGTLRVDTLRWNEYIEM